MSASDTVQITITRRTAAISRAGFGSLLIVGPHSVAGNTVQGPFEDVSELTDAGYTLNGAIYNTAALAKQQNPSLEKFYVGRQANVPTQVVEIAPTNVTEG